MLGSIRLWSSVRKFLQNPKMRRVAPFAALALISLFLAYLAILDRQLNSAFALKDEFIPTRIYSDVFKITSPMPKLYIEERLKALGYSAQIGTGTDSSGDALQFHLHPIEYPSYLIPQNHPTFEVKDQPVTLHFDGPDDQAPVRSIEFAGHETPEIFLEPELVATLSRGSINAPKQIRQLVDFGDIPANVWKAIIAIEDQHFMEHKGLDPRGLARALWVDLRARSFAQGGSTITQQLVKNLMARRNKNLFRKVNELFLALLLEVKFDKEQILERYLNEVYLGQVGSLEIHGVAEGAEHFFGKKLDDLNLAEITLMAGLIRGPGYYSPYRYLPRALERGRLVLKKMVETGQIAQAEADAALHMPIHLAPPQNNANKAPYFTDFAKAELIKSLKDRMSEEEVSERGFRVYTTLDMSLNLAAQRAVTDGVAKLQKQLKLPNTDRLEGALASVDQNTGNIRALIGGANYTQSTFNRILNMKRQVGSTFKPFVYLTAFHQGYDAQGVPYGPGHPAEDAPWTLVYDHGNQTWSPKNYEKEFLGWISYRTALAHSINTVAARLGFEVGIPKIIETAKALGIESDLPSVPSLSLGVAELSPIELLRAYAAIANHGVQDEITVLRAITEDDGTLFARFVYSPKTVYEAPAIDLLTDTLQTVFDEGTGKSARTLGFDRPAAGKTGTTSLHRDSWFAGYTPQLTTVVWVGLDQDKNVSPQAKKINLTGATSALPIWVDYMKQALVSEPPLPFALNPDIVDVAIDTKTGNAASWGCPSSQLRTEKYIKDRLPRLQTCEAMWPPSVPKTIAN